VSHRWLIARVATLSAAAALGAASRPAAIPDPCLLITPGDAQRLVGPAAMQKRAETSDETAQTSCIYRLKNVELNVSVFKTFDKVTQADLDQYQAKALKGVGERAFIVKPYGVMFEKHRVRYFVTYTDRSAKNGEAGASGAAAGIDVAKSIEAAKVAARRAP
jgi:hypothetical protein